ncbi:MAG: aldo/keto reductase, partial [Planctomycetota bacterium]
KGAHHNADRRRVTPFDITSDLHDSLARLGFEYIDLYLLHRDDATQPVEGIVDVLNEHLAAGRIHAFGASNWTHKRIAEANAYARQNGLTGFVASSPNFSLAQQNAEPWEGCVSISGPSQADARKWYQSTQMPLMSWSSLAGGFFAGQTRNDTLEAFQQSLDGMVRTSYASEENFRRLKRAETLADEKGLTVAQIAAAWVLCSPMNTLPMFGPRSLEEFDQNLAALDVVLSDAERDWLDLRSDQR